MNENENLSKFTIETINISASSVSIKDTIERALFYSKEYNAKIHLRLNGIDLSFSFKDEIEKIIKEYNVKLDNIKDLKETEELEGGFPCFTCADKTNRNPPITVHRTREDGSTIFFYCTNCKNYFSFDGKLYKNLGYLVKNGESVEPY